MDIPGALWRRKWMVLAIVVVATAAAATTSLLRPKAFTATTKVWVKPTLINPPGSVPLPQTIILPTEAELVRSMPVAAMAAETVGSQDAPALLGRVGVTFPLDSQILQISFTSPTPEQARDGSQAFADAYLIFRGEEAQAQLNAAITKGTEQLEGLQLQLDEATTAVADTKQGSPEALEASNQVAQLNGQIAIWENAVSMLNITSIDAGSVLTPATAPGQPSTPSPAESGLRGALLGLALGVLAALTAEAVRRRRVIDAARARGVDQPQP